jgi:phosphate transport system substrate-binding protein
VNQAGNAVAPDKGSFAAAAANANWEGAPGFRVVLTNQAGAAAWPIAGATFILMHRQPNDAAAAAAALKFFDWAYAKGGATAEELDYVPMPASVVAAVEQLWAAQIKDATGRPIYTSSAK